MPDNTNEPVEKLKRFDPEHDESRPHQEYALGNDPIVMTECADGDWLRRSDVLALLAQQDQVSSGVEGAGEKVERYEKALRFYADHRNYEDGDNEEVPGHGEADVNDEIVWTADGGYVARAALGLEPAYEYADFDARHIPAAIRDAIYAALAATPDPQQEAGAGLRKVVEGVAAKLWADSQRDTTIIRDAGYMQDAAQLLEAALSQQQEVDGQAAKRERYEQFVEAARMVSGSQGPRSSKVAHDALAAALDSHETERLASPSEQGGSVRHESCENDHAGSCDPETPGCALNREQGGEAAP